MQKQPRWVDKNNIERLAPEYVNSVNEALEWYNNIYDENQTGTLPKLILFPIGVDMNPMSRSILKAAAIQASKRKKSDFETSGCNVL